MDGKMMRRAELLRASIDGFDPESDRDTLVWAHGFLSAVIKSIELRVPDLITTKTLLESVGELQSESKRLDAFRGKFDPDDPDALERIKRELGGPGDAPVPARRKPGPKGKTGGMELALPDPEIPM